MCCIFYSKLSWPDTYFCIFWRSLCLWISKPSTKKKKLLLILFFSTFWSTFFTHSCTHTDEAKITQTQKLMAKFKNFLYNHMTLHSWLIGYWTFSKAKTFLYQNKSLLVLWIYECGCALASQHGARRIWLYKIKLNKWLFI